MAGARASRGSPQALAQTGPLPLRRQADGFTALLDAIVGQQVSVASANAIWARLEAAGLTQAEAMAAASDEDVAGGGPEPAEGALCPGAGAGGD